MRRTIKLKQIIFKTGKDITSQYPAAIAEDILPSEQPDYYVLTVFAIDRDGTSPNNDVSHYSINDDVV